MSTALIRSQKRFGFAPADGKLDFNDVPYKAVVHVQSPYPRCKQAV